MRSMHIFPVVTSCLVLGLAGCATTSQRKMTECTVTISSTPKGALVLASHAPGTFSETNAFVLGNTPLRRLMEVPEDGMKVTISKRGYETWRGMVVPASSSMKAQLQAVDDTGRRDTASYTGIVLVPARVGCRVIGGSGTSLDESEEAETYRQLFLDAFSSSIRGQRGICEVATEISEDTRRAIWSEVERQMEGRCFERIPHTPEPIPLEVSEELSKLASSGHYILLLRAEAYYISGGKRFARVAAPIAMTIAGAAISMNNPVMTSSSGGMTTSTYVFPVFGAEPTSDAIVIQEILLNPDTMGIEWCGQLTAPFYFREPDKVQRIARQAAALVPDRFVMETDSAARCRNLRIAGSEHGKQLNSNSVNPSTGNPDYFICLHKTILPGSL